MADDILKNIIIKFRSDTKEIEKSTKVIESSLQRVSKLTDGKSTASIGANLTKSLERANKEAARLNMNLGSGATRLQKTIQEIASKDITKLGQELNKVASRTESRIRSLQRLEAKIETGKANGMPRGQVERLERMASLKAQRITLDAKTSQELANRFSVAGGFGKPKMSTTNFLSGGLLAVGAGLEAWENYRKENFQARASIGSVVQNQKQALYARDFSNLILEQREKGITKSAAFASKSHLLRNLTGGALAVGGLLAFSPEILGALGIGAAAEGAGALAGGAAAEGGGAGVMALLPRLLGRLGFKAAGAAAGGYGIRQLWRNITGAEQGQTARELQSNIDARKAASDAVYFQRQFQSRAEDRFQFARQTGMDTGDTYRYIRSGLGNLVEEPQMLQAALAQRNLFGGQTGARVASQGANLYAMQGINFQTAQKLATVSGFYGQGGVKQSTKMWEDVMKKAFTNGIQDSGMLEIFEKGLANVAEKSLTPIDMNALGDKIITALGAITGGNAPTPRQVQGAVGAMNWENQVLKGGGEWGMIRQIEISKLSRGNPEISNYLRAFTSSDKEMLSAFMPGSPLATILGPKKFAEASKFAQQFYKKNNAVTLAAGYGGNLSSTAAKANAVLKHGGSLQQAAGILATGIGLTGNRQLTFEAAQNEATQMLMLKHPELMTTAAGKAQELHGKILPLLYKKNRTTSENKQLNNLIAKDFISAQYNKEMFPNAKWAQIGAGDVFQNEILKLPVTQRAEVLKKIKEQEGQKGVETAFGAYKASGMLVNKEELRKEQAYVGSAAVQGGFGSTAISALNAAGPTSLNGSVSNLISALQNFTKAIGNSIGSNPNMSTSAAAGGE